MGQMKNTTAGTHTGCLTRDTTSQAQKMIFLLIRHSSLIAEEEVLWLVASWPWECLEVGPSTTADHLNNRSVTISFHNLLGEVLTLWSYWKKRSLTSVWPGLLPPYLVLNFIFLCLLLCCPLCLALVLLGSDPKTIGINWSHSITLSGLWSKSLAH